MTTMADIAGRVQQRLEEVVGPPGVFWDYQNEILPIIAEAMNEAALVSGTVQVAQNATLTLPINTTYITMPPNVIALLRIQGPPAVQKTDIYSLDQMMPGWQTVGGTSMLVNIVSASRTSLVSTIVTETAHGYSKGQKVDVAGVLDNTFNGGGFTVLTVPSATSFTYANLGPDATSTGGTTNSSATPVVQQIQYWFPVGLNQFGIFPQLTVSQQVSISYLAYPVTVSPPYTGTETVPFQQEFLDGLQEYAAHVLRLKEAGYEFQASQTNYQEFLDTMRQLAVFQSRHDSLVFTTAAGAKMRVNPVEVR